MVLDFGIIFQFVPLLQMLHMLHISPVRGHRIPQISTFCGVRSCPLLCTLSWPFRKSGLAGGEEHGFAWGVLSLDHFPGDGSLHLEPDARPLSSTQLVHPSGDRAPTGR